MPMTPKGYFDCLQSYMNLAIYGVNENDKDNEITLKETVFVEKGKVTYKVKLKYSGKLFALKLDKEIKVTLPNDKKKTAIPLFNFLDNNSKPWSKRCDFVLFNYDKRKIRVFMFEFKSGRINAENISRQLKSSENWCKSLTRVIKAYTNQSVTLHLTKYALTTNLNPSNYLDINKYLNHDSTVRHYNYSEIDGMHLDELDSDRVETIK